MQILYTLRYVSSFLDVFSSDLLPPHSIVARTCTAIINDDPHTETGKHWLAVHIRPKPSGAYYFDSYGVVPLVKVIHAFIKRNCTTCDYNRRQL